MALVYNEQKILREVVEQTEWACTGSSAVKVTRVVLDAGTVTELLDHLQIVLYTLLYAFCLCRTGFALEEGDLLAHIEIYLTYSLIYSLLGSHKEVCGEEADLVKTLYLVSRNGVDGVYRLNLIVEEEQTIALAAKCRHNIYSLALDTEGGWGELDLCAGIERIDKAVENLLVVDYLSDLEGYGIGVKVRRISDTVKTRHTRHNNYIAATGE